MLPIGNRKSGFDQVHPALCKGEGALSNSVVLCSTLAAGTQGGEVVFPI